MAIVSVMSVAVVVVVGLVMIVEEDEREIVGTDEMTTEGMTIAAEMIVPEENLALQEILNTVVLLKISHPIVVGKILKTTFAKRVMFVLHMLNVTVMEKILVLLNSRDMMIWNGLVENLTDQDLEEVR